MGLTVDRFGFQGHASNGSGVASAASLPPLDEDSRERAQSAEAERALNEMWAMASTADLPGAEWEFRYWAQGGALTLLSFRRTEAGAGAASPSDRGAFLRRLEPNLPKLLGMGAREVTFSLEREEAGWDVDLDTSTRDEAPLQARTLPVFRTGTSETDYPQVLAVARAIQRLMKVPRGGRTRLEAQVTLQDARILGWEPTDQGSSGSGLELPASEAEVSLTTNALRPFLHGLGERTVALKLEGAHREGERRPRWCVVEARTLEPPPPPKEMEDFGREYLAMRERILLEAQQGMREGALYLASFSLEQVATVLLGDFLLNRTLVLFEAAAPTVTSVLARGGRGAVLWLRNLLVRMPAAERAALQQLFLKAETQGFKALTAAEEAELRALMGRMENILSTPLKEKQVKDRLREWARTEYFESYRPDFSRLLGRKGMESYQVHHVCPLEYTHLFPELDINGRLNLVGVHEDVHMSINKVWTSLRPMSEQMTAKDVKRVMDIIQRHYNSWFDKVYDPTSAPALARAEQAALAEVSELKTLLTR